jgi:hypothetical protein
VSSHSPTAERIEFVMMVASTQSRKTRRPLLADGINRNRNRNRIDRQEITQQQKLERSRAIIFLLSSTLFFYIS